MKKKWTTIVLFAALFAGLSLLLYPTVSNYWNSLHASKAIATYTEEIKNIDRTEYDQIWEAAVSYNQTLSQQRQEYFLPDGKREEYYAQLNISGNGTMGYIEIPSIKVSLPIYHGTDESVLQVAVGHLDWSSLPVGGESTHCVLSGHRGLPSAKLFTDLDELVVGDTFVIRILDEILTYEVDKILIVEPTETDALLIEEGKDLCTLVTCTPYGINSHRLLVRGHRIENTPEAKMVRIVSDAIQVEPLIVAAMIAVPILLILLILLAVSDAKKKRNGRKSYEKE